MKNSLLITAALVLAMSCPTVAQDTETKQKPVVEKLTLQQSLPDRSASDSQTLGEALRGPGHLLGRKPLIIVDGVRSSAEDKSDPMDTKVSDIMTISIVKSPTELALYGPEGANGVILITTKRGKLNQH